MFFEGARSLGCMKKRIETRVPHSEAIHAEPTLAEKKRGSWKLASALGCGRNALWTCTHYTLLPGHPHDSGSLRVSLCRRTSVQVEFIEVKSLKKGASRLREGAGSRMGLGRHAFAF